MGLDDYIEDAVADEVEVDFSGAMDFDPLEGEFPFIVSEATKGTVKTGDNAGKPKITLKCQVTDGSSAGRTALKDLPLHGKGSGITKKFLKVADYPDFEAVIDGSAKISLSQLKDLRFNGLCRKSRNNPDFTDIYGLKEYDDTVDTDDSL